MKKFIFMALFLVGVLFVSGCTDAPQKSLTYYMGGGGGGGDPYCGDGACGSDEDCAICEEDCGSCVEEYKYEIELVEDYDINNGTPDSEITADVVLITAIDQASSNTGLKLGPHIESDTVAILTPSMPGQSWGPKYYVNDDGDHEDAGIYSDYTLLFTNGGGLLDYVPYTGQMYYEPYGLDIDDHVLLWQIVTPGENIYEGFEDFGATSNSTERFEFFVYGYNETYGNNFLGEYEEDLVLSEQMTINDVAYYLKRDMIKLSFFI